MITHIPKIILTKPKMVVDVKCHKCKKMDIAALPYVDVQCKNCHTLITTEANINIYFSISKKLEQLLSYNNEVWVIGRRQDKTIHTADDNFKSQDRNDDDIYSAMEAIKNTKIKQLCWEVSDITNDYDFDYKVSCNQCGFCLDCVECNKCHKHYTPKTVDTYKGSEKRFTCICGYKSYHQTKVTKFKVKDGKIVCPHCDSANTIHSSFEADKKKCPKCGTEDISKPKRMPIYKLVIKRQKRFELK
jgi:hypothetical protein